jgi:hypothetical protein
MATVRALEPPLLLGHGVPGCALSRAAFLRCSTPGLVAPSRACRGWHTVHSKLDRLRLQNGPHVQLRGFLVYMQARPWRRLQAVKEIVRCVPRGVLRVAQPRWRLHIFVAVPRPKSIPLFAGDLARVGASHTLELEVLADGVIEQSHCAPKTIPRPSTALPLHWSHHAASICGAIAQLGERLDRTQEVGGSSPPSSIPKVPAKPHVSVASPRSGGATGRLEIAICARLCPFRRYDSSLADRPSLAAAACLYQSLCPA